MKINLIFNFIKNNGIRYLLFRIWYLLSQKLGLTVWQYPTQPPKKDFIKLEDWKKSKVQFLFKPKEEIETPFAPSETLAYQYEQIKSGKLFFFNAEYFDIGSDYNWLYNINSKYTYDANVHWTKVNEYNPTSGDIKFVWEKSRFAYLHTVIRHDYHFQQDHADFVFAEISSWIKANPINCGPNYRCSQEISLRILNWSFALSYYKNSTVLTEELFSEIMHHIYWQLKHVYSNINFSRIAVRNNHAITETLMLYLGGLIFPFFDDAKKWKQAGKKWFQQEVDYQIYDDGTHLLFSTNYNRVVMQLLTLAVYVADANGEKLDEVVYQKTKKTFQFLFELMETETGQVPNYGANDGSLPFKMNDTNYNDYRSQLNTLYYFFTGTHLFADAKHQEETNWYANTFTKNTFEKISNQQSKKVEFKNGGYATFRDANTFTFIKCSQYKDRPTQADNLHLDLWYDGKNIMQDNGSYKYNASLEDTKYFMGTASHNTVMLGDNDQMEKGGRFIWYYWNKESKFISSENEIEFIFEGKIKAFEQVGKNIFHKRKVTKIKAQPLWKVEDEMQHNTNLPMNQIWHPTDFFFANFEIKALDENGFEILPTIKDAYHSCYYGIKEKTKCIIFSTSTKKITTEIVSKQNHN